MAVSFVGGMGSPFAKSLIKALGLEGQAAQRVVVDIPHNGVVKVYVQRLAAAESIADLAKAFEDELKRGGVPVVEEVRPDAEIIIDAESGVRVIRDEAG